MLCGVIVGVNDVQQKFGVLVKVFELGDFSVDFVKVMVVLQQFQIVFCVIVEVCNCFVQVYQDVMNMLL